MTRRVAHVITRCIAGAGGVAVRGALSLPPDEFESVIITGSGDTLLDRARAHGVDVVVMPELVSPIDPRNDGRAYRRLRQTLREQDVDVVHTHSAKAGALGRLAAHEVGVPRIVHTLHGFPFHDFQPRPVRSTYVKVERWLATITDATLAVGTAVAVEALRLGLARPDRLVTIGPAVEPPTVLAGPATRAAARLRLGLDDRAYVVGTVGRLDFQKAPEVMIDAIDRMATDAVLVWIGGGPLLERCRALVTERGLDGRVHLLGPRDDVPDLLPAFDVFAMSSRYEGLPCAVVEAQGCGIPVVATRVNAVPDVVVPGETGLLVAPQNAPELAAALDYARTHPAIAARWAERAQGHLGDRYDIETLGEVLRQVYALDETGSLPVRRMRWRQAA